jgi:putative transposase
MSSQHATWRERNHTAAVATVDRVAELPSRLACPLGRVEFVLHDREASFSAAFEAVFQAAGIMVIRSAVQVPRMNSIMERWIGSCRRGLPNRNLIWNQRHLLGVLREYEVFYSAHRPHRTLNQASPLRPLPRAVTDLDHVRAQRRDRAGGVLHEYHLVA